jgi:hypothetical protein
VTSASIVDILEQLESLLEVRDVKALGIADEPWKEQRKKRKKIRKGELKPRPELNPDLQRILAGGVSEATEHNFRLIAVSIKEAIIDMLKNARKIGLSKKAVAKLKKLQSAFNKRTAIALKRGLTLNDAEYVAFNLEPAWKATRKRVYPKMPLIPKKIKGTVAPGVALLGFLIGTFKMASISAIKHSLLAATKFPKMRWFERSFDRDLDVDNLTKMSDVQTSAVEFYADNLRDAEAQLAPYVDRLQVGQEQLAVAQHKAETIKQLFDNWRQHWPSQAQHFDTPFAFKEYLYDLQAKADGAVAGAQHDIDSAQGMIDIYGQSVGRWTQLLHKEMAEVAPFQAAADIARETADAANGALEVYNIASHELSKQWNTAGAEMVGYTVAAVATVLLISSVMAVYGNRDSKLLNSKIRKTLKKELKKLKVHVKDDYAAFAAHEKRMKTPAYAAELEDPRPRKRLKA